MVTTNLNLSMNNPEVVQIHAKQGDSGRIYKINLKDATEENGTLRILRPDGVEVTADAIKSASGDAYKGDLVTFDALEEVPLTKCEVTLESSQDLHGQSSPYPSGGGKNKFDIDSATMYTRYFSSTSLWQKAGDSASFAFYCQQNTQYTISCNNSSLTIFRAGCINVEPSTLADSNSPQIYEVTRKSSSGSITLTTTNDAVAIVVQLTQAYAYDSYLQIELGATATTYAPYSNICPIYPSNGKNLYADADLSFTRETVVTLTNPLPIGTYMVSAVIDSSTTQTYCSMVFRDSSNTAIVSGYLSHNANARTSAREAVTLTATCTSIIFRSAETYSTSAGISATWKDIQIEQGTTATPYVPYQGINLYQVGKNLFDATSSAKEWVAWNGTLTTNANAKSNRIKASVGDTFTLSNANASDADNVLLLAFIDGNNTVIGSRNIVSNGEKYITAVAPANTEYVLASFYYWTKADKQQLEFGETATSYEPYNGTTYPLSLGQTVYGGKVDLVSGKLTVTHGIQDLGSLSWGIGASDTTNVYSMSTSELNTVIKKPSSSSVVADVICESYPTINADSVYTKHLGIAVTASGDVRVYDSNYNTNGSQTSFKTAMNGVNLVYELATPIEYDLTPTQISTLLGENNIWSSGEVEVAFEYDGLFAQLPQQATAVVGRCLGDVNFTNVSTMPFTLNVIPNNQEETP